MTPEEEAEQAALAGLEDDAEAEAEAAAPRGTLPRRDRDAPPAEESVDLSGAGLPARNPRAGMTDVSQSSERAEETSWKQPLEAVGGELFVDGAPNPQIDDLFVGLGLGEPVAAGNPPTPESQAAVVTEAKSRAKGLATRRRQAWRQIMTTPDYLRASRAERQERLNVAHDVYGQMMVLNAIKPLGENLGPSELLEAATTMAVVWMLNDRFRKVLGMHFDNVVGALRHNREETNAQAGRVKLGASAEDRAAAAASRKAQDAETMALSASASGEGLLTMGVDDAVELLIAMDEALYDNMRTEGADIAELVSDHRDLVDGLREQWVSEGLDFQRIKLAAWDKIGVEAGSDEADLARYRFTSHGALRPTARRPGHAWDGMWRLADGSNVDKDATPLFPVRLPMSPGEHRDEIITMMKADLAAAVSGGPDAIHEVLLGYQVAPDLSGVVLDPEPGQTTNRTAAAASRGRMALAAMCDDGLPAEHRQSLWERATSEGLAAFSEIEPAAMSGFAERYPEGVDAGKIEIFTGAGLRVGTPAPMGPTQAEPANYKLAAWCQSAGVDVPVMTEAPRVEVVELDLSNADFSVDVAPEVAQAPDPVVPARTTVTDPRLAKTPERPAATPAEPGTGPKGMPVRRPTPITVLSGPSNEREL